MACLNQYHVIKNKRVEVKKALPKHQPSSSSGAPAANPLLYHQESQFQFVPSLLAANQIMSPSATGYVGFDHINQVKTIVITRWLLRYAISYKNVTKKKFRKFSVEFFFKFFMAICVPQPIWGMPAKIWGGLGPLVWEKIDPAQTVYKPKLKFLYRADHKAVALGANKKLF
jgi:hypothetical protein